MTGSRATTRERMLSEELIRIRSTYSFRLGLLLTDAMFRRPWMIPLLPFTFMALNVRYIRERKIKTTELNESKQKLDSECLFLICTNEEGIASAERVSTLAQEWLGTGGKKIVVMSTIDEIHLLLPKKSIVFPVTDPKKEIKENRSLWNAQCENLIGTILDAHQPKNVIFDGPYPYRGVLNAIKYYDAQNWIWLRTRGLEDSSIALRGETFDQIATIEVSKFVHPNVSETKRDQEPQDRNLLLMAPHYNTRSGVSKKLASLVQKKVGVLPWDVALPEFLNAGTEVGFENATKITHILENETLSTLRAAIVPPNIELIAKLMEHKIPTLCLFKENSDLLHIKKLQHVNPRIPLMCSMDSDFVQIEHSLQSLLTSNKELYAGSQPIRTGDLISQILN